nr:hypothetical protein [Tanacetum cinerariifolium]
MLILIITMRKSTYDKKDNKSLKRKTQISVRTSCFVKSPPTFPPYQCFSPPSDYQTTPPSTPLELPPTTPIAPHGFSRCELLTTPTTTPLTLTSPPPTPTQPSKQFSSFALNIEPIELTFSTPPTSNHHFFDSLEDLPPHTINPPPSQPTSAVPKGKEVIEHFGVQLEDTTNYPTEPTQGHYMESQQKFYTVPSSTKIKEEHASSTNSDDFEVIT